MRILSIFPVLAAVASAADYNAVDPLLPPKYAPGKLPVVPTLKPADIALIAKIVEEVQGYDSNLPEPVAIGDGVLTEQSYPEGDLSKVLSHLLQKKHGLKATVKILNRLPGVYGDLAPYTMDPSVITAAYKHPALGLGLPYALAQPHLNLLYPPSQPAYHLPLHAAHKLPLTQAGVYGYPGYARLPALGVPPLPLIIIIKGNTDSPKVDDYEAEAAAATEPPSPPVYAAKPKKHVVKVVVAAKKAPSSKSYTAVKVHPKTAKAKIYAKATNVKPLLKTVKVESYPKTVKVAVPAETIKATYLPKPVQAPKLYVTTEATVPAGYAVEVSSPDLSAPAYSAVANEAADAPYPVVEARAVDGGEAKRSSDSAEAGVANSDKNVDAAQQSLPDGGESARASLSDHNISSQQTISRIS